MARPEKISSVWQTQAVSVRQAHPLKFLFLVFEDVPVGFFRADDFKSRSAEPL
jgi:hypothetical protein